MAFNTFVFLWQVTLDPGDVLFVPKKWWHYVQSLDTSISINTWIELVSHCHNLQVNLIWTVKCVLLTRGPFLESPGNFSGLKSNIQIEI